MKNALRNCLATHEDLIDEKGYKVSIVNSDRNDGYAANLDGNRYVGTIGYWQRNNLFEIQFNSCDSGDVILLETNEFQTELELSKYIETLLRNRLI